MQSVYAYAHVQLKKCEKFENLTRKKIQRCIPKSAGVCVCVCVAVCVMSSVISPANNVLLTRQHSLTTDLQICTYKYGERKESLGIRYI